MTNGISWPVVLIVFTPEIPATSMVLSTKRIKQAIAVRVSTCAKAHSDLSSALLSVSVMDHLKNRCRVSPRLGSVVFRVLLRLDTAAKQGHEGLEQIAERWTVTGVDIPEFVDVGSRTRFSLIPGPGQTMLCSHIWIGVKSNVLPVNPLPHEGLDDLAWVVGKKRIPHFSHECAYQDLLPVAKAVPGPTREFFRDTDNSVADEPVFGTTGQVPNESDSQTENYTQ